MLNVVVLLVLLFGNSLQAVEELLDVEAVQPKRMTTKKLLCESFIHFSFVVDYTSQFQAILTCVTEKLKNGIPEIGIPSMDPLQIDQLNLDDLDGY